MASFLRRSAAPCSKCTGLCATPVPAVAPGHVSHSQQTHHRKMSSAAAVSWPVRPKRLQAGLLPAAVGPAAAADSRAAAAAAIGSGESHSKPDFDLSVYLDAAAQPGHFVGPVAVANIPGKGCGLVATAPLSPGQLLLVVPPLALLEGGLGEIPDHEELVEVITSSGALFSPWQASWLKALTTTTAIDAFGDAQPDTANNAAAGSSADSTQQQQEQPVVPGFLPPTGKAAWLGIGAGTTGIGSAERLAFDQLGMDEEQLWAAVVLNCYGEGFQDLPASLCAGAPLSSQLGLWGAFSMLNHACCPNAVNYTLRDCMVVRCCAPVCVGGEVVINYLGRSALTPRSQRQAELEACYGFNCDCKRCRAEAAWSDVSIQATSGPAQPSMPLCTYLDQLHTRIGMEFEPQRAQIMQAMDSASEEAAAAASEAASQQQQQQQQSQEEVQQLVHNMQQEWAQLLAAAKGRAAAHSSSSSNLSAVGNVSGESQQEACWVLASSFDLLGLLHDACQTLGKPDASILDAIVQVCEQVCPGSDLHVFQALIRTSLAQQQQQQQEDAEFGSTAADQAMRGLVRALQIRYGPHITQDQELLQKLFAATSAAANMVWL